MACLPHRPSILQRPTRAELAKANVENLDAEFKKEQQRVAARAERLASTEERLIKSFYPTQADKRSTWESTQQELQQHGLARAAAAERERQQEERWMAQPQQVFVDSERPWTAHGTTYFLSKQEEDEARRRMHREAAEQNRLAVQYRSFQQQQERELEQQAIRSTMQSEDAWFNLGAASERWIPPEHRIKQRATVAPQFMPSVPPYHCDALPGPTDRNPSRPSTAPAGGRASDAQVQPAAARRNPFWERDNGAGAKSALSHDIYFRSEQAAAGRRPVPGQRQQSAGPAPPSPSLSFSGLSLRSTSSLQSNRNERALQVAVAQGPSAAQRAYGSRSRNGQDQQSLQQGRYPQGKYPWSWDA